MKRLFSIVLISIISACASIAIHPYCGTDSIHNPSPSRTQTLRWAENATFEQRRIIGAMIENMVLVKGGTITMGDTSQLISPLDILKSTKSTKSTKSLSAYTSYYIEQILKRNLNPVYTDTLNDYYICKYEVTQEEWEAVMGFNPSYSKGSLKPVEYVNYIDCQTFIQYLNELTGLDFSLPTTEQWEYAARGGNKSRSQKHSRNYNVKSIRTNNQSNDSTTIVGSSNPNILGLYDMDGNVMEWCLGRGRRNLYTGKKSKRRVDVSMPHNKYYNSSYYNIGLRLVVNANHIYTELLKNESEKKGYIETLPQNAHWQSGRNVIIKTDVIGDSIYADDTYIGTSPIATELALSPHRLRIIRYNNGMQTEITKNITVCQDSIPLALNFNLTLGCYTSNLNKATDEQRRIIYELIESMVIVRGGTFTMGATPEQGHGACGDEHSTHRVTLSDYHIGKYEVTQEQWQIIMGNNPSKYEGCKKPVENISWNDCQKFIQELNKLTGLNFALPTEAQWEYAARGGNKSQGYKYSGSNNIYDVAWHSGRGGTKKIGIKQPNELGIYDMSGNVWEWCQDWYGSYNFNAQTNPKRCPISKERVRRGGGWASDTFDCRTVYRYKNLPDFVGNGNIGLRLVINSK